MAKKVILPALGMAQETGKIVRWLKAEGEQVERGEPLAEIETDKATVDLEAPADGVLANVTAAAGDDVPVGQVIALILAPGEQPEEKSPRISSSFPRAAPPSIIWMWPRLEQRGSASRRPTYWHISRASSRR